MDKLKNIFSSSTKYYKALFKEESLLSEHLPYESVVDENFVMLKDGSFGVIYQFPLFEHEPLSKVDLEEVKEKLVSSIVLDEKISCDVLYLQRHISGKKLNSFKRNNGENKIAEGLLNERIDFFSKELKENIFERNVFMSFRYYPKGLANKNIQHFLSKKEKVYFDYIKDYVENIKEFKKCLLQFEGLHLSRGLKKLDGLGIKTLLKSYANPYSTDFVTLNEKQSLSKQVFPGLNKIDFSGICDTDIKTRTFSLSLPDKSYLGQMTALLETDFPLSYSLKYNKLPTKDYGFLISSKDIFLSTALGDVNERMLLDLRETQEKYSTGDKLLNVSISITVYGRTEDELDHNSSRLKLLFLEKLNYELLEEETIGFGLFLTSLPLSYNPKVSSFTKRSFLAHQSEVTDFFPIYDSFNGFKTPLQHYVSREGNLCNFDLFSNQSSHHTVVLADTGAGKSFFLNSIRHGLMAQKVQPLIFILEKKTSNKMATVSFNGELNEFSKLDTNHSPFRGIYDEQKVNFLTTYLKSAVKMTSESFKWEAEHDEFINRSIRLAYNQKIDIGDIEFNGKELISKDSKKSAAITVEDIISTLSLIASEDKKFLEPIDDLKIKLMPFYGEGKYSDLFDFDERKIEHDKLFYVYDIDGLDSDPIRRDLLVLSLFDEIRQIKALPQHSHRDVYFEIDEIAQFDSIPYASELITQFAEMGRKEGIWLVGATNRPSNYVKKECCKAMWSVADNFIFLQMGLDNAQEIHESYPQKITEVDRDIIASLKTKSGEYSEVYYLNKSKTKMGAFRYHATRKEMWLTPSNIKAEREVNKAFKQFGKNNKALDYLLKTFPNGIS